MIKPDGKWLICFCDSTIILLEGAKNANMSYYNETIYLSIYC
jgi:hypothetical protein